MPPLESEGTRFSSRFTELRTSRFRGEDAFRPFTPGLGISPNFEDKVKAFTSPFLLPFRETNRTRQDRVIQLASRFQMGTHPFGLTSCDPKWQFQEERWRRFAFLICLLVWRLRLFLAQEYEAPAPCELERIL